MKTILFLALLGPAFAFFAPEQNWYNFKTHWTPLVYDGFQDRPRTVADAEANGWTKISEDCTDGAKFPGIRYAFPGLETGPDMVLIFDVNGYIAGMHSVVLERFSPGDWQSGSIWYREDVLFGEKAYLTTAYFVSPSVICTGRSQAEFDTEGTGNMLLFQNGETSMDTIEAPADLDEANNSDFWFRHFCFLNMGRHYFNLNYDTSAPCNNELVPIQLVYSGDVLNGFVWQHVAKIPGNSWESVDCNAIGLIIDRPPSCLCEIADNGEGVTTMHTYLRNYETLCVNDRDLH